MHYNVKCCQNRDVLFSTIFSWAHSLNLIPKELSINDVMLYRGVLDPPFTLYIKSPFWLNPPPPLLLVDKINGQPFNIKYILVGPKQCIIKA